MDYDVVIIGAGLGGLTAGAKLAKEGRKVLLLEQHDKPGGCATTFKRGSYVFDVSLIETIVLNKDDFKTDVFAELGILENIKFLKLPEFYRFVNGRVDITLPYDPDRAIEVLLERFPAEEKGIRKFFDVILGIMREIYRMPSGGWQQVLLMPFFPLLFPRTVLYQNKTVGAFLDAIVRDDDLKLVLQANLFFYHDDPYTMSLLWFAVGQGSFFTGGGHYIQGGSQLLSNHLAQVIRENGGEIRLGCLATRILTEHGAAVGVEFKATRAESGETQKVYARKVIANTAVPNVANTLLSGEARERVMAQVAHLKASSSVTTVYLGLRRPLRELGNSGYCTIVYDESIKKLSDIKINIHSDFSQRYYAFVDYGMIDSRLAPEGKSVAVLTAIDYLRGWEGLGPEEYRRKKEEASQHLVERLNLLLPGSKEVIEYAEAETPVTIGRFTLNPEGAIFGYAEIPKQAGIYRIAQKSVVKNLYFASAWTTPGGNYTGAILSGYSCAKKVLGK